MKFSIVFPSRDRIDLLRNLLRSIAVTTYDLNHVEVLIAIDDDDKATYDFVYSLAYSFVKPFKVPRSLNFSQDYYTFLANKSTGRWIITVNDDCVFETMLWDKLAFAVLDKLPGVIYGWSEDGLGDFRAHGHGEYCCFPLQGRAGIEAMGYVFPSRIPTWGADIWCKNIYDQVRSTVQLPITIRHFCHHNHTREQDEVNKRIMNNQIKYDLRPTYDEVNKLLSALRQEVPV
jgi:glycosyltransferase involved in cell wall biosynthesis